MKKLLTILLLTITAITSLTLTAPQLEASTTSYNVGYQNGTWDGGGGQWATDSNFYRSIHPVGSVRTPIPIINNSIIISDVSKVSLLMFWNGSTFLGSQTNASSFTIPSNATHFSAAAYSLNHAPFTYSSISNAQFNAVSFSYITPPPPPPVAPTFGTDTITWNYDPITDELTATFTSTQPTYSANDITARGIITGTSADYNSPDDLSNVAGTQHPKTNGYTGTQTVTIVNPPRGEQLFMRSYVQYNNQDMFYSPGVAVSPPNYAVRQLDYIDWNGFVLATYYPELYSTAQAFDIQTQSLIPAREGYVFNGFTGDTDITTELKVFQRTAQYTQLQSYTVTFVDWDNTVLGTDTVYEGQPASPPVIPTRTGYTFDSWLPPIADIQGNITTVAQYTPNTYLVTWNNLGVEILAEQLDHDDNILDYAPFVTREDYNLVGWKLDPTEMLVTSGQVVTSPLSLTAVWEAVPTYTVTWRDRSFNTLKIEYVQESGLATAPTYDPGSGLVLSGWTPDPTQPISQNTIFIATVTNAPTPPPTYNNENATSITDLFAGVFGAIVGSIMILGTIDLFGIELSALLWLFIAGTGFMMIWKMVR